MQKHFRLPTLNGPAELHSQLCGFDAEKPLCQSGAKLVTWQSLWEHVPATLEGGALLSA